MRGEWWREGVFYEIYPRSFVDSNGDGIGDLAGMISQLDYLEWLGIDGIWLNPTFPSPNADWGYDVSDYRGVHPDLGTLDDLDRLVAEAGARGIRILLDIVPNHTSDEHVWFVESRASRENGRRDWYVWVDPKPDGSPPNNWLSVFGGPAWKLDEQTGQYYLHNFHWKQPDLNWWNDDVRDTFDDILRFWLDRGIAGFRIDVANALIKDRELRDNPPATEDDFEVTQRSKQRPVYNANRPEVHDVFRRWRGVSDAYDGDRVYVGEAWVREPPDWAAFFGTGTDELHMAFDFLLLTTPFDAESLRGAVETTEAVVPAGGWPALAGSNHDVVRFPTRWCGGDERKVRCALILLLTLRGTPFIYYGDEIGMTSVDVPPDRVLDCTTPPRDPSRTPMQWSAVDGAGFTADASRAWLPLGDHRAVNVEEQRRDPASVLNFCRDLIAVRREHADLRRGAYTSLPSPPGVWAWRRGESVTVALNLADEAARIEGVEGSVAIATDRTRDGERIDGALALAPWAGAVVVGAAAEPVPGT